MRAWKTLVAGAVTGVAAVCLQWYATPLSLHRLSERFPPEGQQGLPSEKAVSIVAGTFCTLPLTFMAGVVVGWWAARRASRWSGRDTRPAAPDGHR